MTKKTLVTTIAISLLFGAGGFVVGNLFNANEANAQEACVVDRPLLERIYGAVFHRPLDGGADFHLDKPLATVLSDVENAEEHDVYSALFNALKAYEEAIRAPGELSEEDKAKYLDLIDTALAQAVAWAETLPEQADEDRVVGPKRARQAILKAYERMNPTAQLNARGGLMRALQNLGSPEELPLPGDFEEEVVEEEETTEEETTEEETTEEETTEEETTEEEV